MSQGLRRNFLLAAGALLTAPLTAQAQQSAKVYRIGILPPGPYAPRTHLWNALRQGLRDLGYVEGQNISYIIRSPEERPDRLPTLAAELVGLKVDVIVTSTDNGILAAKGATKTIPIVMAVCADPVDSGFISSVARPGANITGMSFFSGELAGKRLELIREVASAVSDVGMLLDHASPSDTAQIKHAEVVARSLGMKLRGQEVRSAADFETAFEALTKTGAGAVLIPDQPFFYAHRTRITDLAIKHRLPLVAGYSEFAESGALMSYGPNIADLYRRAAIFVHKILKGANPAELPVEQPTKFELLVNMKTAKALGLTIPRNLLLRASRVIE